MGEVAGGIGLARAGRHLHEGTGAVGTQARLHALDRVGLAGAQARGVQRRKGGQAGAETVGFAKAGAQGLGTVHGEGPAGHRDGISTVTKLRLAAGGQIGERQRITPVRIAGRRVGGIIGPLRTGAQQSHAFGLGFQHRTGLPVQEQHIVRRARRRRHFANGHARTSMQVQLIPALHNPPGGEHRVDLDARTRFGRHAGATRAARSSMRRRSRIGVPGKRMKLSRS